MTRERTHKHKSKRKKTTKKSKKKKKRKKQKKYKKRSRSSSSSEDDVACAAQDRLTRLLTAAKSGDLPTLVYLLSGDGAYELSDGVLVLHAINAQTLDVSGASLLDIACIAGHPDTVEWLIDHGCSVQRQNAKGQTPLHHACDNERPEVVAILVEHGADPETKAVDGSFPLDLGMERLLKLGQHRRKAGETTRLQARQHRERREQSIEDRDFANKLRAESMAESGDQWGGMDGGQFHQSFEVPDWFGCRWDYSNASEPAPPKQKKPEAKPTSSHGPFAGLRDRFAGNSEPTAKEKEWHSFFKECSAAPSVSMLASLWTSFRERPGPISFDDVPFPTLPPSHPPSRSVLVSTTLTPESGFALLIGVQLQEKTARKGLMLAYRRWHPDKFVQAFGASLSAVDRTRVLDHVTRIAQFITKLKDSIS